MKRIYLDYAATTPVDRRVLEAMEPYFSRYFGNPSSLHSFGRRGKKALERARKVIAEAMGAESEEIIFTSSATESNNLALKGLAWKNKEKPHILISSIEHDCVMNASAWLGARGFEVEEVPVDKKGMVHPEEVEKRIRKETLLVSVMHANNEIGTIEPVGKIGEVCRKKGVLFHTDAAQTFGRVPLDVKSMKADLVTVSSHKMYGPKGVGALYKRKGVSISPLLHGGGHERGLRSSTPNVAGAVGFGKAVELCLLEMEEEEKREAGLRDKLIKGILERTGDSFLNGHPEQRLPNNVHLSFKGIEGEAMTLELDERGIAASTGSACSATDLKPSHVLLAIGLRPQEAHGSLRLSLGRFTTDEEVEKTVETVPKVIEKLRKISPF